MSELSNVSPTQVSSHPVRMCYCTDGKPDCSLDKSSVSIVKGDEVQFSLVIVDQVNNSVSGTIHVEASSSVKDFDSLKQSYTLSNTCTNISIRLSLQPEPTRLALYAVGPCNSLGISQRIIKIQYSECACPIGFSYVPNEES